MEGRCCVLLRSTVSVPEHCPSVDAACSTGVNVSCTSVCCWSAC